MARPHHSRRMALVLVLLSLAACTTWEPTAVSPKRLIEEDRPHAIRINRIDGRSLVVRNPVIARDSVAVVTGECRRMPGLGGGYQCPKSGLTALSDVRSVEVQVPSSSTAILLIGIGVIVGAGHVIGLAWEN